MDYYAPLVAMIDGIVAIIDHDFNIIRINPKTFNIIGLKQQNLIGKNFIQLYEAMTQEFSLRNALLTLSSHNDLVHVETQFINSSHTNQSINWKISFVDNNQNQKIYLLLGTDITAEKIQQQKNSNLLIGFDSILKNLPGYVYWKDKNSVYLGCNENFAKVAGLDSHEQICGKTDYDLAWSNTEAELFRLGDQEVIAGNPKYNFEEPQLRADGKHSIVLATKMPVVDEENNIVGLVGIYTDITERKQVEHDLKKAKERAEIANKAKSVFMANMTHDIRTPLTGVIGLANMLESHNLDSRCKEAARDIVYASKQLLSLLNEIIEVTRCEMGLLHKDEEFSIKDLLKDIELLIRPATVVKNLNLTVASAAEIPSLLIGQRTMIHRILLNLVSNAVKFTHQGHIAINAELIATNNSSPTQLDSILLKLIVKDSGIGFPEQKKEEIFGLFNRLSPSYAGIHQGFGLGLYIVKQFIEQMGASIEVESEHNKGSKFICTIPLKIPMLKYAIK